jgi:hypothetical protein
MDDSIPQLSHEDRSHFFHRLQFTNDQLFYQYVQSQAFIKGYIVIDDRHNNLSAIFPSSFKERAFSENLKAFVTEV